MHFSISREKRGKVKVVGCAAVVFLRFGWVELPLESDHLWSELLFEEQSSLLVREISQDFLGSGFILTALNYFVKLHTKYKFVMTRE